MNLTQALEIVKDHIRIGKGMELTNGVPEALEMVVDELESTQKALELACEDSEFLWDTCGGPSDLIKNYLTLAKEGVSNAD